MHLHTKNNCFTWFEINKKNEMDEKLLNGADNKHDCVYYHV